MRMLFVIVFCLLTTHLRADDPNACRWFRQVDLPEITTTTLVAVPLDLHFYQHTREHWPYVRVSDDHGKPLGFVIRAANDSKPRVVRKTWAAQQTTAKVDSTTGLQVELALRDGDPPPTGIRIITPLRDFEHQVRLESSANGLNWTSTGPPSVIFDYSRYVDARCDQIVFTQNDHRRFRVTVEEINAEQQMQVLELERRLRGKEETESVERTKVARIPFRIDRIEFFRDEEQTQSATPKRLVYPVVDFSVSEDAKERKTVVSFDMQRQPLVEIKVNTPSENFSREAVVEAEFEEPDGKPHWRRMGSGKLTRFAVGSISRDDRTLVVEETYTSRYRILIENRDSPPLTITDVEVKGPQYELLFLANSGQKLQMQYGSRNAHPGQFDRAAVEAALAQGTSAVMATLQPSQENPNFHGDAERPWKPWNDMRILVGIIIASTILLGWGLFRASQRLTQPPEQ